MIMDDGYGLCSSLDILEEYEQAIKTQQCHFLLYWGLGFMLDT